MSYVCEKSVGAGRSCDFRSGKVILQQPVERAQMTKLLAQGRTDLLDGFVSSRTRRRFKAFLVRQPDGKVGFEFQAAAPRPGAKPAADGAEAGAPAAKAGAGRAAATPIAPKAPAAKAPAKKAPAKKTAPARSPVARVPATPAAPSKTASTRTAVAKKPAAKAAGTQAPPSKAAPRLRKAG